MREIKWFLAAAVALLSALSIAPVASGHPSPGGCTGSAPSVSFHKETLNRIAAPVRVGDSLVLGAQIDNQADGACDLSELTVRVRLPQPDGSPGQYRTLTSDTFLAAGSRVGDFAEVSPYIVDLNETVSNAFLELSWSAVSHSGDADVPVSGSGSGARFTVTRPRAELTVTPSSEAGFPPLFITNTYRLKNASPSNTGVPGPALNPSGPDGPWDALADANCSPLLYLSGDESAAGPPALDPGETWNFSCTRTLISPGTFASQPLVTGISSADERPWPQPQIAATAVTVLGPDLTVEKSHRGDLLAGRSGRYSLKVTNIGNRTTNGTVTVVDRLPAGLTATAFSGDGWSCDPDAVSCQRSDPLESGGSYPDLTLKVKVDRNPAGSVTNTASVSGGGETFGATANNSDSDPTTIRTPVQPEPSRRKVFRVRSITGLGDGSAAVRVTAPAAGQLSADDARKPDLVRRTTRKVGRARTVVVIVKANRRLRRQIARRGKPRRIKVRIAFKAKGNPNIVNPISIVRRVTFDLRP